MDTDQIWSLPAVQQKLSIKKTKMHELIKRGEIDTFRWEGRQYVRDDDLRAYIAKISGRPAG